MTAIHRDILHELWYADVEVWSCQISVGGGLDQKLNFTPSGEGLVELSMLSAFGVLNLLFVCVVVVGEVDPCTYEVFALAILSSKMSHLIPELVAYAFGCCFP